MPPRDRHWSNCTKPIAPNSSHIFTWNEERRQIWASNPIWSTALDILTRKYHGYKDLLSAGWSLVTDPQLWIRCWVLLQAALVGLTYADDDRRCNFARCIKCAFATQAPEVSWLATWIIRWIFTGSKKNLDYPLDGHNATGHWPNALNVLLSGITLSPAQVLFWLIGA